MRKNPGGFKSRNTQHTVTTRSAPAVVTPAEVQAAVNLAESVLDSIFVDPVMARQCAFRNTALSLSFDALGIEAREVVGGAAYRCGPGFEDICFFGRLPHEPVNPSKYHFWTEFDVDGETWVGDVSPALWLETFAAAASFDPACKGLPALNITAPPPPRFVAPKRLLQSRDLPKLGRPHYNNRTIGPAQFRDTLKEDLAQYRSMMRMLVRNHLARLKGA